MNSIATTDLFNAYYQCRKNKRNTINALAFELNYESNLLQLCEEINNGSYTPGRSIVFIVNKPVKREIFAADFRDRIVHHLLINKLNPLFEKQFIYDSYSCRVNKGTHFGINRVVGFVRKCSKNYKTPCYVLKLDIEGFFMHIDKNILFNRLHSFINEKYIQPDKELIIELCKKVIFNDPTKNCFIKGKKTDWNNLPKSKSLFHSPFNCGLPIGNLTSQIFANFYLDKFDHFLKHDLQVKYYGRYVDDFVIVHTDKEYLKSLVQLLSNFLLSALKLNLHPRKIYLQPYQNGVKFLGAIIKPNRVYITARIKNSFYNSILQWNAFIKEHNHKLSIHSTSLFLSSINSYLGTMCHYNTFKLRKKILIQHLSVYYWNYVYISGGYRKLIPKKRIVKKRKINCL